MLSVLTIVLSVVAAMLLIAAALHDIAARTVPNLMSALLASDGVALKVIDGSLAISLAVAFAVFFVATLMWRRGLMGGGDVKLLAAAALVVPPALTAPFLITVALAGGVLALLYLGLRRVVGRPNGVKPQRRIARLLRAERRRIRECRSLPYACAIATGALFVLIGG